MRMRRAAVVAGLALGLMSTAAQAVYIIDINQIGSNIVVTGNGSIDLSGSTFLVNSQYSPSINAGVEAITTGSGNVSIYNTMITGSDFFASGSRPANQTSGLPFGFRLLNNRVFVPQGYISNTIVGPTIDVYSNTTYANLGLTPGASFTYFIPTAGAESFPDRFVVNVGVSPVPLPASAPMFGAALLALGAVGYGVKRKKAAAQA